MKNNQYYINREFNKLIYRNGKINNWYVNKIKNEQDFGCNCCKNKNWMDKPLVLEIHHKDGNRYNNDRSNLECLCPNCHSQTKNWKTKGGINKYPDQ